MTTYFMVSGQNEVLLRSSSPTATAIETALQNIPLTQARALNISRGQPDPGGFVGSARIVRRAYLLPPGGRITTFSWLYELPDPPPPNNTPQKIATRANDIGNPITGQLINQVRDAIRQHLDRGTISSDWSNVTIAPYDPAVNGTIAWWRSGEAGRTATRDEFDLTQQAGQTTAVDSPAGPTGLRPPSIRNPLPETKTILIAGGIVLGVMALYYAGPAIRGIGKRSNPRRRTKR
jgi:hypothetical protein